MAKSTVTPVSLIERVASELAESFDNRASILVSCRLAYEGMDGIESGKEATARRDELSNATQRALAARYGIPTEGPAFDAAVKVPANRPGGIGVSPSAIKQRAAAYSYVLRADLTPDILNVTAAFRLASITGKGHAEFVAEVVKAEDSEAFIKAADEASDTLTANRPKKGARPNDGTDEGTPLSADAVLAVLDWAIENVGTFTDEDRAAIQDRLATLAAVAV